MRAYSQAQGGAPPPQVAGLLCKNHWFLHEARWAGHDARIQRFKLRLHADRSHHAAILVLEQVTVIDECADRVGVSEVHA